jgi:hypothetical protein
MDRVLSKPGSKGGDVPNISNNKNHVGKVTSNINGNEIDLIETLPNNQNNS